MLPERHCLRFGFVRTPRFVFRMIQAGTEDACFVFLSRRIFLGEDLRAPMGFQAQATLFKLYDMRSTLVQDAMK